MKHGDDIQGALGKVHITSKVGRIMTRRKKSVDFHIDTNITFKGADISRHSFGGVQSSLLYSKVRLGRNAVSNEI